jgi:hypothetical protein
VLLIGGWLEYQDTLRTLGFYQGLILSMNRLSIDLKKLSKRKFQITTLLALGHLRLLKVEIANIMLSSLKEEMKKIQLPQQIKLM